MDESKPSCSYAENKEIQSASVDGDDINKIRDKDGNTALHLAIIGNKMKKFKYLLRQENINMNAQNVDGNTPFHLTFEFCRRTMAIYLLEAGCDINMKNASRRTPLQKAVEIDGILQIRDADSIYKDNPIRFLKIIHELINRGADMEGEMYIDITPLHWAVRYNNLEALTMLLYYNADANFIDCNGHSPFMRALAERKLGMAEELMYYQIDFENIDFTHTTTQIMMFGREAVALGFVKLGAYKDTSVCFGTEMDDRSFHWNNLDPINYRDLWLLVNNQLLVTTCKTFFYEFLTTRFKDKTNWLHLLYFMLTYSVAGDLINEFRVRCRSHCYRYGFWWLLLYRFNKERVPLDDRIKVINMCLAHGNDVNIYDLDSALRLYNFGEELEFLLQCCESADGYLFERTHPMLPFILGVEDFSVETVLQFCLKFMEKKTKLRRRKSMKFVLGFFSMSYEQKEIVHNYSVRFINKYTSICKKLKKIPEFPSLIELARNSAHKCIRLKKTFSRPYQFHNYIKSLPIPTKLQDLVRFKTPLY